MSQPAAVSTIALKTFPLFYGLPEEELAAISRVAMMRRIPRGHAVVREGDRSDFVYFVLTGSLKVVVSDEDGKIHNGSNMHSTYRRITLLDVWAMAESSATLMQ